MDPTAIFPTPEYYEKHQKARSARHPFSNPRTCPSNNLSVRSMTHASWTGNIALTSSMSRLPFYRCGISAISVYTSTQKCPRMSVQQTRKARTHEAHDDKATHTDADLTSRKSTSCNSARVCGTFSYCSPLVRAVLPFTFIDN